MAQQVKPPNDRKPHEHLALVKLDNKPVHGLAEAKPTVRQILQTAKVDIETVDVFRLRDERDTEGEKLTPETIVDRTASNEPIKLRSVPRTRNVG